jgi:integrase/recombinase XerC
MNVEGVTHENWLAMLQAVQSDGTARGVRDAAILLLLHDSALRSREVATLRLRDYAREKGIVRVWQKGRDVANRVDVRLSGRTAAALNAWCAIRTPSETLFHAVGVHRREELTFYPRRVADVVRYWCRRAGFPPVGPHQLRHAAITRLSRLGEPLVDIQRFARHADVNTTTRYIHAGGTEVQRCVDRLGSDE